MGTTFFVNYQILELIEACRIPEIVDSINLQASGYDPQTPIDLGVIKLTLVQLRLRVLFERKSSTAILTNNTEPWWYVLRECGS